ncbi:MAG: methyltransferase domain-containing protein [Verrucomicrobiota bacterium]|nr:methyltransferase domain-containing protein [Verrucomicrobiota bacterium]
MSKDWNKAYDIGETPWDKGYASPALNAFLGSYPLTGSVLVPGCGTGHDVRLLAAQGVEVVGMDIAPNAIRKAKAFLPTGKEYYELGDFLQFDSSHYGVYDWVVEHTCLCAIDPLERPAYVRALKKALKPSGQYLAVLFREVRDPTSNGPPYPISRQQCDALFGDAFEMVKSYVPEQSYSCRPFGTEELCWMQMRLD